MRECKFTLQEVVVSAVSYIVNTVEVLQGSTASHHVTAGDNRRDLCLHSNILCFILRSRTRNPEEDSSWNPVHTTAWKGPH